MDKREIDELLEYLAQSERVDEMFKKLAGELAGKLADKLTGSRDHQPQAEPVIQYIDREIVKEVEIPVTPAWAKGLEDIQQLVQSVRQYPELAAILLGDAPESQQVMRLLVCGAQWSNILRVWDVLVDKGKQTQQPAGDAEVVILRTCVALYNQTLQDCKVELFEASAGERYDYSQHQRANVKGDRIQTLLLPGLLNAAGDNVRSVLVLTV